MWRWTATPAGVASSQTLQSSASPRVRPCHREGYRVRAETGPGEPDPASSFDPWLAYLPKLMRPGKRMATLTWSTDPTPRTLRGTSLGDTRAKQREHRLQHDNE